MPKLIYIEMEACAAFKLQAGAAQVLALARIDARQARKCGVRAAGILQAHAARLAVAAAREG